MSRVSAAQRREAAGPLPADAPRSWAASLGWVVTGALVLLALYLLHPLLEGYRLPLGPDGPVYVWWERFADAVGLSGVRRPGVSGVGLLLETALRADALAVVTALEPVLAVATGLAGAALAEAALGHDLRRAAITALLVGSFAAFLAPGWLANLTLAAILLVALAAFATAERAWRGALLGAALLAAAAVTHALFLAVAIAIIGGALLLLVPTTFHRLRDGEPLWSLGPTRIVAGTLAGAGLGALGLWAVAGGPRAPGDSSQDHFLRRLGLDRMLRARFRERLAGDARHAGPAGIAGLSLAALLPAWWHRLRDPGRRLYVAVAASWALVTAAGVVLLWWTGMAPAGRLLNFAYFVPLLAGPAAALALRGPVGVRVLSAVLVVVMAGAGFAAWYRRGPYMTEHELRTVGRAAAAARALPPDTPLVFLVDTRELAAGFHISRFGNVVRAGLPGDRIDDARMVVGSPADLVAGRPGTGNLDPEYRAIARASLAEARPVLDEAAVFVLEPFNRPGFPQAVGTGVRLGPDAIAMRLPRGIDTAPSDPARALPSGTAPWAVVVLALGALALLGLLGAGWTRWGLVGGSRLAAIAAAPAAGAGLAVLSVLVADRLGLPAAAAGSALAALLGAAGYLVALRSGDDAVDRVEDGRA